MERLYEMLRRVTVTLRPNQGLTAYDGLIPTWRAVILADGSVLVDWHGGDVLCETG